LAQTQETKIIVRLAGGVAHDFNNMLSVILGYVGLAKLRLPKEHPVLKDIAEIEKAAIRSRNITRQLLAFSRKQIIEPKIIDINELVTQLQKALSRLITENIDLNVLLGGKIWPAK
jgi:two-component system, cell cycle sensor histidine kinase and response regulator CckA